MHKKWLQVLLLCVAYAICLHGNCAAENNVDNWVKWYEDHHRILFVNENFVNVREYNGRKYLELATKINTTLKPQNKEYISRIPPLSVLFDVERNTSIQLVTDSKIQAIELTKTGSLPLEYQALLRWAERKYPTLINELREHNRNHPLQIEVSNAPITGSEAQTVTANGDYGFVQTLGDGPVQFVPRMIHTPPTYPRERDSITRYYVASVPANGILTSKDQICPPTAPDSHKPLYIIYDILTYSSFSTITIHAIFSYDDATNTFTLYDRFYDFSRPLRKIHIIDKNTVEGTYWDDETYSEDNPLVLQFKYVKALPDNASDRDGFAWTGWDLENDIPAPIDVYFVGNFGASNLKLDYELVYAVSGWNDPNDRNKYCFDEVGLDGLFAFLARKGNVGYAPPAGPRYEYW